ncbi:ankyrin repeat domain-containing protein [Brucella pseudogrignonensis]|uniref:ankyrin repeat domain-containing protein n=1 Tax=Brucella pseudogrignonensis TaxID=419475 RepID=UPI001E5F0BDD|nr:ankyrin repeat domain-containing protein [Brucella pseudogrignonensis]MCD4512114.1 ankyrin repeat domain-containing protein [Brucella pseudogrignonensis]
MLGKLVAIAAVVTLLGGMGALFGEPAVSVENKLQLSQAVPKGGAALNDALRLEKALLVNDYGGFVELLRDGADPNALGSHGYAAVHIAAQHQNTRYLEKVLEHGGNPNLPAKRLNRSPLFNALDSRRPKNRDLLIKAGANIEYEDAMRKRPLKHAADIMDSESVVRFLELGADPSAADDLGNTFQSSFFRPDPKLLHWNARRQYRKVIRILDERGVALDPKADRYR